MDIQYPVWIPKQFGSAQEAGEMNGLVEVLQNHAENISEQHKRIVATSGGIYPGKIVPTSNLPENLTQGAFIVSVPGTYSKFGNVVLPVADENNVYIGLIFWDGTTFSLETIAIPKQDMQPVNDAIQRMDDFIRDFAVEVDQTFDETSENAIANKEVYPLNKVLKYFTTDTLIDDMSDVAGDATIYNKDLTPNYVGDKDNSSIYKHDLTNAVFLHVKFRVPNYADPTNLTCITFEKLDGNLFEYKAPNPLSVLEDIDVKIDVSTYKNVTITWNTHQPRIIKTYSGSIYEEDGVKKYIDLPLKSFINGTLNPQLATVLDKSQINTNPYINGVQNYINHILRANNTLVPYTEVGSKFYIWKDVPTKISESKRIIQLDIDFVRIGGGINENTNLLGIKKDGTIINIIGSQSITPTGNLEKISIDLTPYVKFSLQIVISDTNANSDKTLINVYENGNIEENSVLKYINENGGKSGVKVNRDGLIHIDKPTTLPIVNIVGVLPTDSTDARTPTNVEIEYIIDNTIKFKCKSSLSVQGNATAAFAKKGFEAILTNYSDEELKVQFGGWGAFSEFHLKAYPNDQTFARDLTAGKLWYQMRTSRDFPNSYIADFNAGKIVDVHKENLLEQALFYTDGFPIELRVDGQFYGIYVWRIKKERDNYMINNANTNHIFLDNEQAINWRTFTPADWKVRSPKIKGYVDGGEITDAVLLPKLNRWWDWFKGIDDGTIDFENTVDQYLNVDSWVDAFLMQQTTAHWDYQINNILLTSWDGIHLSVCYYDGDQTFGFVTGSMGGFDYPLTVDNNGLYWRSDFWRNKLYPKLKSRIQTRYTELRAMKIIDAKNIYETFRETTDIIPREIYDKELNTWRISSPDVGKHSLRYCMNWTVERIKKLDLIWKI